MKRESDAISLPKGESEQGEAMERLTREEVAERWLADAWNHRILIIPAIGATFLEVSIEMLRELDAAPNRKERKK